MMRWSTARRFVAIGVGAAVTAAALTTSPASAASGSLPTTPLPSSDPEGWGPIVPGPFCAQAYAYSVRKRKLGFLTWDFGGQSSATPTNPNGSDSGGSFFDGILGVNFTATTKVGVLPDGTSSTCVTYAQVSGRFSGISGILAGGSGELRVTAIGRPGQPAEFSSNAESVAGRGLPLGQTTFNEIVRTDINGMPVNDPNSSSGYINAIRSSFLSAAVKEAIVGHAAVLIDPRYLPLPECSYTYRCAKGR